ncbi:MAG: sel1 repeat family protein [Rhodocyclales bacterium GT-UBC]|nr:MAG: sel1 repeat family protein [Rhodocyclales bacterium GT-UBC]
MTDTSRYLFTTILTLALVACGKGFPKERLVPDLPAIQTNLAFTCAYEKDAIPPRAPEADQLYVHARWLRKNNLLKEDPLVYPKIERLIRIATAYGHDKANLELRQMIGKGTAQSENITQETLDLTEELIQRGIPGGYYDMGRYLERGYGVKQDKELAGKYYRKSADLGSPEGQYLVGDWLTGVNDPAIREIGVQMWRCAVEQGHGEAGLELGVWLKGERNAEALQAFQLGAKVGSDGAASFLEHGFDGPPSSNELYYLGQQKDLERVRRYKAIGHFLFAYDYLNPKVPEIDRIVPLPPAKLPPWDGSFQWLKTHEANVPPPLPSEERIQEMARAKHLDPETGRPLKDKHSAAETEAPPLKTAAAPTIPLGLQLPTGATCPHTGTWACSPEQGASRRVFVAGETLAGVRIPAQPSLWQKLKGEAPSQVVDTTWTLVELPENRKA